MDFNAAPHPTYSNACHMWQVLNGLDSEEHKGSGSAVGGAGGSRGRQSQLFVAQLFISFNWRPMRKQFVGPSSMCGAQAACGMWHAASTSMLAA